MIRSALVAFALAALALSLPSAAAADSTRWLPGQPGFGDMVVDDAGGHVFISPGRDGSRLLVRDLDGAPVTTIGPVPGATGMVLSGTTLYVALCDQSSIAVIDTTTLTETSRIPLGTTELSGTCDLALAGGRLFFPVRDQWTNIASVPVSPPHTVVPSAVGSTFYDPHFAFQTTATSSLSFTQSHSGGEVAAYDVTTPPGTLQGSVGLGTFVRDSARSANGQFLTVAGGASGQRLALPSMAVSASYTASAGAIATAISADGNWVAFGRDDFDIGADLLVYPVGSTTAVRRFDPGYDLELVGRSVRFDGNATRLYAITTDWDDRMALSVFDSPTSGPLQPAAPPLDPAPIAGAAPGSSAQFALSGMPRATDIAVDAVNSRIFIAPGPLGSSIAVRNLDGSPAGTIADEVGATSLVLHGGKLYVSMCGATNAIDVINPATLVREERISLTPAIGGNCALGLANGRLFYPNSDQWVNVASVTVATPHTFVTNVFATSHFNPVFATSPNFPNRLLLAETGISTTSVEAWNIGTGSTATRAAYRDISGYAGHIAVDPLSGNAGVMTRDLRGTDMSIAAKYSPPSPAAGMAYSEDGQWVAALDYQSYDADLFVFARGDNVPRRRFEVAGSGGDAYEPTVAFSPTGDRLYAVTTPTYSPAAPTLHVIDAPTAAGPVQPDFVTRPSLTGSAVQGATLTCAPGTWTGSPTFTYAWQRNGAPIAGATAATYVIGSADSTRAIRCVVRASTPAGGVHAATDAVVVLAAPTNQAVPTITGAETLGATLTCSTGTWTGATSHAFQWRRNGAPIPAATTSVWTVDASDFGTLLTCSVTATGAGGSTSATSSPRAIGGPPLNSLLPSVSGGATVGATLQCASGTWTGTPAYAYAWTRNGTTIDGATQATYAVVAADAGTTLRCVVSATNAYGTNAATSVGTAITTSTTGTTPTPTVDPTPDDDGGSGDDPLDTTAPTVTITITRARLAAALRNGLRITVRCNEACTVAPSVEMSPMLARRLRMGHVVARGSAVSLAAGSSRVLTLRLTATARRKLATQRTLTLTARMRVTDAARNAATGSRAITLRR